MSKPVVIDLCHGLGGWTKGFLAEGYEVIGFDVEEFPTYPGHSIRQDVRTLCGYDLRSVNPVLIVASPPCQRYSYMAMPWDRAKREIRWQEWQRTYPFSTGFDLNDIFNSCIRIAREAGCPILIENVKGAQRWVGSAAWHFGSYYLWGDVPALMPFTMRRGVKGAEPIGTDAPKGTGKGSWFFGTRADPRDMRRNEDGEYTRFGQKNEGGSWFNVAHNTDSGHGQNPVNNADGVKQGGNWWHDPASMSHKYSSRSSARKAASQAIAEIPLDLANWIARCFKPEVSRAPVPSVASERLQDYQEVV